MSYIGHQVEIAKQKVLLPYRENSVVQKSSLGQVYKSFWYMCLFMRKPIAEEIIYKTKSGR